MAPKKQQQQQPEQRYLGQKDPKTGKVWAGDGWGWQWPATYARLAGERRLNTQRNPGNWVENNLRHLFAVSNQKNQGTRLAGTVGFLPIYEEPGGRVSSSTPAQRQVAMATTVQPVANAALAATNLGQRLLSGEPLKVAKKKPEDTQVGRAIVDLRRQATIGMGATPIEQLPEDQRSLLVDLPSSLATNTALAFVPGLRVAPTAFSGALSKVPFLSQGAQQVLARAMRWGANAGINEAVSGIVDDSTQGQAGDLLKAMGAPVPDAFVTQPGDDRIQAGLRGVIPGIAFGEALGAPLGIASKTMELAPNAMRSLRERRINADVSRVRQDITNAGLQTPDALGGYEFSGAQAAPAPEAPVQAAPATAAPVDPNAEAAAPAAEMPAAAAGEQGLVEPLNLPTDQLPEPAGVGVVDQAVEPVSYSPDLPELDAPALALDQLDDDALKALSTTEGPVLPLLEQTLATQPAPDIDAGRSTLWTAAPAESLVTPEVPWREQWEQLPNTELLGAAAPDVSPDLFEATQGITGKSFEQFSRTDVLDGLSQLEEQGQVVLPQRLNAGAPLVDVQGLQVDPERMQFRGGADPENGVVPGQGIEGPWDPSKEGKIAYWQDPQTGDQILVDGHRRVAAAQRLGIPSIPGEEVLAPTAFGARQAGAIRNIAEGTASPLDGGRALRQQGVTDLATAEAAGIPLDQGTAAGSVAIAQLPDPLFRAVEAGEISQGRAMAIGGSGLDEAGIAAAGRFARSQRSAGLDDSAFSELMQLAGASLRGAADGEEGAARSVGVVDFDQIAPKARLAAQVRKGMEGQALELFNQGKLDPANPVSQMLEQGMGEVMNGSRLDVVSRRLRLQLEEAAAAMPAPEAAMNAAPADAAAGVDAPLTAAQRQALRAQLLQRAIENGEVRPSAQPILPEPDPVSVDVQAGLRDLEQQLTETGTIAPDTPAAKLLEDEARLQEFYAERDAIVQNEMAKAQREAAGFWSMPFDERVRQGLIGDAWKPKAMEDTVDTRGQGRYFHGSSQAIDGGRPLSIQGGEYWTDTNIFGNGFYATEDFATAGNLYTQKGKRDALRPEVPVDIYAASDDLVRAGNATPQEAWSLTRRTTEIPAPERLKEISAQLRSWPDRNGRLEMIAERLDELAANPPKPKEFAPAVYEVVEKQPVRFFDGEQRINWTDNTPEAKALRSMKGELWDEVKGEWEANGAMTYSEMVDELRGISRGMGYSRSDATEVIDSLNDQLMKLGYGGMTHQGGQRAGGGKRLHEVKIYWEPEKQIALKQVGAAGPEVSLDSVLQSTAPAKASIPKQAITPAESLSKFQLARSINDLRKWAGTHEMGLNIDGGSTFMRQRVEQRGVVDLDKLLGPTKAKAARQQFESGQLGAEALEARKQLQAFYGVKPTTAERPFYIELGGDVAAQNQVAETLRQIVREVAGPDADVRLMDRYRTGKRKAEWGGGDELVKKLGSYGAVQDIVTINGALEGTQDDLVKTAYHEAFHRVQYGLLNQQEMRVLDSAYGLQRINSYSRLSPKQIASIERMAVAFQKYAAARRSGADAMEANMLNQLRESLPNATDEGAIKFTVKVAAAFEKLLDVIDRFRNFAKGNGFQTVDDIFERVYSGEIARKRAFDSALEMVEPDQVKRMKRLESWFNDNTLPGKDIDSMLSNLNTQIEALKAKATAGGC